MKPFTPKKDLKGDWAVDAKSDLPNVLILGDSISIGYTQPLRKLLKDKANVYRAMRAGGKRVDNCGDTGIGLKGIDTWLGTRHWDVIHFNWGLWDLCYRDPKVKNQGHRDKVHGKLSFTPEQYEQNLETLANRLEATGAKLIWASTTVVPPHEVGRFVGDDVKYNSIAARVMKRHHIRTDDLYTLTKGFDGKFSAGHGNVHYTDEGYRKIADQVAASIEKALAEAKKK